jgi:apolipoprotein N-acyltransferase
MKLNKFFVAGYLGDGVAVIAGALLTLAFAPFNLFPLALLSSAILLCTWLKVSPQCAFKRGWLYGLGLFGTGVYWVFISIHVFGEASLFLSLFITIGFINILALFPALTGYFLNRFSPTVDDSKILLVFPAFWVLLEWIRSWLFSGFPWLSVGYSQINSFLRGYAPLFSVYGVSMITVLSAGLLVCICLHLKHKETKKAYQYILFFTLFWAIGAGLSHITWTHPFKKSVQVSLVQGNIPQQVKWAPEQVKPTLQRYMELTNPHWDSKIIVWPEGAIPIPLQDAGSLIDQMDRLGKKHQTTFITGIPAKVPEKNSYYNAVVAVGNGTGAYLKHRLVPFGEFTPLPSVLEKLLIHLNIPMSDFIPGPTMPALLVANGVNISAFICYEIAFPEQVTTRRNDVGMILTVSNDAWFGHSIAQAQHLQIAQMRALELGKPVLFVSNNGITAVISADGTIQSTIPPFIPAVLTDTVTPRHGITPWQIGSMDPVLLAIIVMLVMAKRNRILASREPVLRMSPKKHKKPPRK